MTTLKRFLSPASSSLKICGITSHADADRLVALKVDALGVNFWPHSKRYLPHQDAHWLRGLAGRIVRIGVFVNEPPLLPLRLMREGLLDAIQLHGDESPESVSVYHTAKIPIIKALGVRTDEDFAQAREYGAAAILLDTRAPGVFGGTGETFDWQVAVRFRKQHSKLPMLLAGGITPDNIAEAIRAVRPAAIDIASGAESAPGVKDFDKIAALVAAVKNARKPAGERRALNAER